MHRIAALFTVTVVGCLAIPRSAPAEETLPAGWLSAQVNEGGHSCDRRAVHRAEDKLLLACGAAGVWEVDVATSTPRFVQSHAFGGEAVGFFTEPDGRLWVKLQVLEARPFSSAVSPGAQHFPDLLPAAPAPAPTQARPPAASSPVAARPALPVGAQRTGRVLRTAPGEVVISLGAADGVMRSDRIELALEPADDAPGEDRALSREALAVGVVTNVTERSAKVRLGLNETVPLGALASRSRAQPTSSLSAPPRVTGLWALELSARPFAALGELGGGALLGGSIGRRFAGHLRLQAVLDPFAFGDVQDSDSVTAVNASLIASYDSQFFEMGLGFGAQTVNLAGFVLEPGSGLSVAQLIRLGAQDGLNISARTSVVLFHSEFDFGGMVATGQIPVTRGYWLLLSGGGGSVGYGYGELGLRVLLRGNGDAGSHFLTVTAGGAAVFRSTMCNEFLNCQLTYAGPMAGIASEWRF